jgi:ATP-dependent RNA helicase DeaD
MTSFNDFPLIPELQKGLHALGFTAPTEIQKRVIPILLGAERLDLHGQAQTGTGKTLAFGIPLIQKIDLSKKDVQALVVAPTRELVLQITDSLKHVSKFIPITVESIYGGVSMTDQIQTLKRGVHIVIGTPGRLNDHIRRRTLSLKNLNILVLDEADIMLDMGFKEEIDEILEVAPRNRQIWLFSATIKAGISEIMKIMKEPVSVRVSSKDVATPQVKQYFCAVPSRSRTDALSSFIDCAPEFYGFIFCPTKVMTSEVAERLAKRGYNVNALHGDLSQVQRNRIIKKFREREFSILVATDVAARGIDIADLTHVINYTLPDDLESYVHRIGRTGRAGKEGIAITFINPQELSRIRFLERKFKTAIHPLNIPSNQEVAHVRCTLAHQYLKTCLEKAKDLDYRSQLEDMVQSYTSDMLRDALLTILSDKFLRGLSKKQEVPFVAASDLPLHPEVTEIFVGVGEEDGLTQYTLTALLLDTHKIKKQQIKRIKVLRGHSFVVIPGDLAEPLIEALQTQTFHGRRIRISMTGQEPFENRPRGGGRRHR